jgi:hypothetical protein
MVLLTILRFLERRRKRQIAHQKSPANLGNLPVEIIHQIVNHLKPPLISQVRNHQNLHDTDSDWGSVESFEVGDGDRPKGILSCCRPGTEIVGSRNGSRISITDDSLQLSAVSKRLREVIFLGGQMRCRTMRLCQWWIEETKRMPLRARSRYA